MDSLTHTAPSVGAVIKKILKINPELSAQQIIEIVRGSVEPQGKSAGEFASAEIIHEERALEMARASLEA